MATKRAQTVAVFVTRDGYVFTRLLDLTPTSVTLALKSGEIARDGQMLTFRLVGERKPMAAALADIAPATATALTALYEEADAEDHI